MHTGRSGDVVPKDPIRLSRREPASRAYHLGALASRHERAAEPRSSLQGWMSSAGLAASQRSSVASTTARRSTEVR